MDLLTHLLGYYSMDIIFPRVWITQMSSHNCNHLIQEIGAD